MDATTVLSAARVPWNKGKLTGQKPPLKLKEIWAIRIRLQLAARTRAVQFEITEQTRASLQDWLNARPADRGPYVFPSRVHNQPHVTARQYSRIVHGWIEGAGMDSSAYGTHSMRRTKAAQIYRKTGNLRAVQLLLGHTKIESTVRYLGIEVDDALTLSEQVEL